MWRGCAFLAACIGQVVFGEFGFDGPDWWSGRSVPTLPLHQSAPSNLNSLPTCCVRILWPLSSSGPEQQLLILIFIYLFCTFTGVLILLALGLLTPYFYFIPKASLAAVIICAVIFMIEYEVVKPMWKSSRKSESFVIAGTLCLDALKLALIVFSQCLLLSAISCQRSYKNITFLILIVSGSYASCSCFSNKMAYVQQDV